MKRAPDPPYGEWLELAAFCRGFETLPRAGGLVDQDVTAVNVLALAYQVFSEEAEADANRSKGRIAGHPRY